MHIYTGCYHAYSTKQLHKNFSIIIIPKYVKVSQPSERPLDQTQLLATTSEDTTELEVKLDIREFETVYS